MTIPKKARVVFDGSILRVYSWKQRLFYGSYTTFERVIKTDGVVVLATTGSGKVIMIRERQPMKKLNVGMIGGMVERGERPIDAVKRELLEETGYTSDDIELLKVYHPATQMVYYSTYFVVARGCRKVQEQRLDAGERITVSEVSFSDFMKALGKHAVNQSGIAMEMYYAAKLNEAALRSKIFGHSSTNPLKTDARELSKAKRMFYRPTQR